MVGMSASTPLVDTTVDSIADWAVDSLLGTAAVGKP